MSGRYHLTPTAEASYESIGEHTEERWGVAQRDKYLEALVRRFSWLARSPKMGRSRERLSPGLYSYQESRHVIFYETEDNGDILIIDILHEKMEPARHLKNQA